MSEKVAEVCFREVSPTESLFKDGLLDSMSTVDLVVLLEQTFSLKLNRRDRVLIAADTIDELSQVIFSKLQ